MEVRAELKYTKSHEWVKEEGGVWTIGQIGRAHV